MYKNGIGVDGGVFANQSTIAAVEFGIYCTFVNDNAFENCTLLKEINDNNVLEYIGSYAFANCENLNTLDLIKCKEISDYAFINCSNMEKITLSSCEKIGIESFTNCENLKRVFIKNPNDVFCKLSDANTFCIYDETQKKYIPNPNIIFYIDFDVIEKYKKNEFWKTYIDNMIISVRNNQILYGSDRNETNNILDEFKSIININNCIYTDTIKTGSISFIDKVETLQNVFNEDSKSHIFSVDIPSECNTIGDKAFENYIKLNNILLSDTITHIGEYAFKNCKSLTSFSIPKTIEVIGEGVFAGCEKLDKISGKFVTDDGKSIICGNTLIYVSPKNDTITEGRIYNISDIDSNITNLGKSCFSGCDKMIRVDIPSKIERIGENAFEGCNNLCEVHFYGDIPPTMEDNVFGDVRDGFKIFVPETALLTYNNVLSNYNEYIYPMPENNSVIYYSSTAISTAHKQINVKCTNGEYYKISNIQSIPEKGFFKNSAITKVILGEGVNKIMNNAFGYCTELEYIYLPDNITELNNRCFYKCEKLTRIHIPSGLENISEYNNTKDYIYNKINISFGQDIFVNCDNLKEFGTYIKNFVSEDKRCYIHKEETLNFFAKGSLGENEKNYIIPDYVIKINANAFRRTEIETITLGSQTKSIGSYAFEGCDSLTEVNGWNNVTEILNNAFESCNNIGEIYLPEKLERISDYAFSNCINLRIQSIPKSVKNIGEGAFYNALRNSDNGYKPSLTLPNITTINKKVFYGCNAIDKITLNDNTTTIDSEAFYGCTGLNYINVSASSKLKYINNYAFYGCENISEINMPTDLKHIGDYAFYNCKNLYLNGTGTSFNIPKGLEYMGVSCFKKTNIKKLNISNCPYINTIPNNAFEDCIELFKINISSNYIKTIGSSAFSNCKKLNDLTLTDNIEFIKDNAFNNCKSITTFTLPKKLQKMGNYCLNTGSEKNITNIYIPSDIETIPVFTTNDNINTSSLPFGKINETKVIINIDYVIFLLIALKDNWKNYWNKYSSCIKVLNAPSWPS